MSDLAEQILAAVEMRSQLADEHHLGRCGVFRDFPYTKPCDCAGPGEVRNDCAADREIVTEVQSWNHYYCEDSFYSCGLAVDDFGNGEPRSQCANDDNIGRCTCDLEAQQNKILTPLARGYGIQP